AARGWARAGPQPLHLRAARIAGVEEIYRVGGAQAVGAMAYGTASVPRVDKIVGPGNLYVATAKRLVAGVVGTDMIAGPTEIVVVADGGADPATVAADLLAQAEHDEAASAILITTDRVLAEGTQAALEEQLADLPRRAIAAASLAKHGAILVVPDLDAAFAVANRIAPEHLEVQVEDPWKWLSAVRHAGAIFLGPYSGEVFGDYVAGPSHVLPTGGTARFASPLSVHDFQKRSSVICLSQEGAQALGQAAARLGRVEGLEGHARAAERRFKG
ncbi:MAG: histidinol dehydrogenase, partial [Candidatus Methylomirabilales bacterium]